MQDPETGSLRPQPYGLGSFQILGRALVDVERHHESGDVNGLNVEVLSGDMAKKKPPRSI